MKFTRSFLVKDRTDRDSEVPVLLEFVGSKFGEFESLLDIGAYYSYYTYAKSIKISTPKYDGIDIKDCPKTREIVDNYYVGNANTYKLKQYDFVICVSTIEHAGISTYKADYIKEQLALFKRCLELSKKFAFISFPVGQSEYYPDEWAIIERERLKIFEQLAAKYKVKQRYFYTKWAQGGLPWWEHEDREFALSVPYRDAIGNQSICAMEIEK